MNFTLNEAKVFGELMLSLVELIWIFMGLGTSLRIFNDLMNLRVGK